MVWVDTWSSQDLEMLVYKRETELKRMPLIAIEMGRALRSCYDRYAQVVSARPAVEPITPPPPASRQPRSFHARLGIKTFVHRQAVLTEVTSVAGKKSEGGWGYDAVNRCWSNNHLFRASVTLARVLA